MKNTQLFILLLLGLSCMQFQCERRFDCAENRYSFGMGVRAYPDSDSIKIGDTIWLEINEATTLKDFRTDQMIDYSKAANLGSNISFSQLSADSQFTIQAVHKFDFHLIEGIPTASTNDDLYKEYLFNERNGYYKFKLGVVPKQKGLFVIVFGNAANVYRKTDKCTKAGFGINFKETDQHYYFHPGYIPGTSPVGGDYYFKVVN